MPFPIRELRMGFGQPRRARKFVVRRFELQMSEVLAAFEERPSRCSPPSPKYPMIRVSSAPTEAKADLTSPEGKYISYGAGGVYSSTGAARPPQKAAQKAAELCIAPVPTMCQSPRSILRLSRKHEEIGRSNRDDRCE